MQKYRNVKIPQASYDAIERAKDELLRQGINSLPEEVRQVLEGKKCPYCLKPLEGFEVKVDHYNCPHCGYSEGTLQATGQGKQFALGIVVGACAVGLLYLLSRES